MSPPARFSACCRHTCAYAIMSFHGIHNVVDRGVLQAMWVELAGKVGHRDQLLVIC